jgi:hypothetical protein
MKPLLRSFLLGNLTLAAASSLHAATIINFSFEANVNPDVTDPAGQFAFGESRDFGANGAVDTLQTGDENNITGWTTVTTENTNIDGAELAVGFVNITPAEGNQVLSLQSGASTRQFTSLTWSSLSAGDQITMIVAVGDRNSNPPVWADESFFALIDGSTTGTLAAGTLLGSTVANSGLLVTPFTGGLGINGGTMQDRSFTYTVLASDLSRSGNVGVLLAAYGSTDGTNGLGASANQAFFDNVRLTVIPEPSSALLGGLGLLYLLRRRR